MAKRLAILWILLALAMPAVGIEDGVVEYVGGTAAGLHEGDAGKFDLQSATELAFVSAAGRLAIPFGKIDSYGHTQVVARHLGVVPAVAVGLVKKRQSKHYLRIAYHDENNTPQVVIFEVPKQMPMTLMAVLAQRVPQGCKPAVAEKCRVTQ